MKKYQWIAVICGGLCFSAQAQTMIDGFEYASDEELLAAWAPSANATISLSDSVAPRSTGKKSLKVDFNFPSVAWATETVKQYDLAAPVSISPTQYVTFRLRGDSHFAPSDFRNLYLYAYDADGNFARWPGLPVPLTDEWQIVNFKADALELPWDSTTLPDLSRIARFGFYQYGSQVAIDPYSATIYLDDLTVRDTPLTEFPAPAAPRTLIDDFESYKDDAGLAAAYTYQNSPNETTAAAALLTPAPQGKQALKLTIGFAPGLWPWGSVWSAPVPAFSIPADGVVTFRVKGDPSLAAIADSGTTMRISFEDKQGGRMDFYAGTAPVIGSDWTTIEAPLTAFASNSPVDTGNLVRWQILVEGWKGTADQPALSGSFLVDDILITTIKPSLTLSRDAGNLTLTADHLTVGKSYELRACTDFSKWSTSTVIQATASSMSVPITASAACSFYQIVQQP